MADQLERTCMRLSPETNFFIRKAIGWVLRELSEEDRITMMRIFSKLGNKLSNLSRKEATRKLPAIEREALLKHLNLQKQ
jgi:3-methyladenine DNA glycosylase AlkD